MTVQKINVLHVLRPAEGGMKEHVLSLLQHLDKKKYNLLVASPQHKGLVNELRQAASCVTIIPIDLPGEFSPWQDWKRVDRLKSLLQELNIHLVHTHGARAGFIGRLAACRAGVPIIVNTAHNFVYETRVPFWKKILLLAANRWLAHYTSHHIAISQAMSRQVRRLEGVPPHKISTIYNGIDLSRFQVVLDCAKAKKALGIREKGPVVAVIARLIPAKGVAVFMQAAVKIKEVCPDAQFLIIGDGPQRRELEAKAERLGIAPETFFLGFRQDVPAILPLVNVVAVPSLSEGLSIGVLEAMAARRPVVASRVGGLPELVQPGVNGILVPPGEWDPLAKAIISILENPVRAEKMGRNGRLLVEEKFQLATMVRETEKIYDRLIAAKGPKKKEALPLHEAVLT